MSCKNEKNANNEKSETSGKTGLSTSMDAMTTRQAAQVLGVSVRTVQLWVEAGALAAWKTPGGHRRVSRASVEGLLKREGKSLDRGRVLGPQVVVVEDDPGMQRLYRAAFDRWDVPLLVAGDGFEGLLLVGEHHPSVVIADLQMPGMDGFAMVRTLVGREDLAHTLLLVVTGLSDLEIAQHGGLPAEVPVLHKPVQLKQLEEIVLKQLAQAAGEAK